MQLTAHECRILGVLVEKAQTTPAQYPLTLNAIITGSNQKSNRSPVLELTEDDATDALDGLRSKGLLREVMLSGSRVQKFRHVARETLEVSTSELVILAELLLRGPRTVGELRGRASRMHPLETIEVVNNVLEHLMARPEPLVRRFPAAAGSRAPRFAQLLCPALSEAVAAAATPAATPAAPATGVGPGTSGDLERRVTALEAEMAALRVALEELEAAVRPAS